MLTLRPAAIHDIPKISHLAEIIWNQHYRSIIGEDQILYMLGRMYSKESLKEQMEEKQHLFFFIEDEKETLGFLSAHRVEGHRWFLNKFYILQEKAGKGIGSMAFDLLCQRLGAQHITLTVNRQNFKSINFYFKKGFTIDHVADFDIGNGYVMNDFVMVWKTTQQ